MILANVFCLFFFLGPGPLLRRNGVQREKTCSYIQGRMTPEFSLGYEEGCPTESPWCALAKWG
ncbi:GFRA2 isoform 3 [Pan troglodytes]|uniref:GFRA2 isoform 3 n=1 Tax=Pan troglodytes TaxID=9598 RepID=A0A2J8N9G4_PANTR|nr:GFRA2 isoform 3 [Pan troglodytes]